MRFIGSKCASSQTIPGVHFSGSLLGWIYGRYNLWNGVQQDALAFDGFFLDEVFLSPTYIMQL